MKFSFAFFLILIAPVLSMTQPDTASNGAGDLGALRDNYTREIRHPLDGWMRSEPSGLRSAYLTPIFPSSHAASLLALHNGDLICFWFSGSWEGHSGVAIVMSRLPRGTSRWSTPVVVDRRAGESYQNPVGFQAPDGTVWLLHTTQPADQGEDDARVLVLHSKDGGKTWSNPADLIDTPGAFVRNPVLIMPDGAWMLPMYFTSAGSGPATKPKDRSVVAISSDYGTSWKTCDIPDSNGEVQPAVAYDLRRGYVALLRSRRADHIYRSTSPDGCHWSPPAATSLPNNNAAIQVLRLPDGNILLAFNNTAAELVNGKPQTGARKPLSLALSSDFGLSWTLVRDIETGRPGVTDMRKVPGREEYSYPALALGSDGRVYLAYTFRRETIKIVSFSKNWLARQIR